MGARVWPKISSELEPSCSCGTIKMEDRLGTPSSSATPNPMNNLDRTTLAASTDLVRLLFGVPAACWGSFSCSHARISGRMYAITTSVLFYSNVLGFERRFCLNFADIVDISLHRTTSLRFELANDEVYVFRSFQDREQVLSLLSGLKRLSGKDSVEQNLSLMSPQLRTRSETTRTVLLDLDQEQCEDEESSSLNLPGSSTSFSQLPTSPVNHDQEELAYPHSAPQRMNRRRAASDSVVRFLGYRDYPDNASEEKMDQSFLDSIHEEERPALSHTMSAPLIETTKVDPTTVWESEKAKALLYENTGVEVSTLPSMKRLESHRFKDVRLECTLDEYFDLFLSDDATHSFTHFQNDVISDKEVTLTDWTTSDEAIRCTGVVKEYHRTLSFTHPIKSSIGPSEARTQRRQTLKRFSSHGMILTNSTQVSGIPAADCFKAEDFWIIEAENNGSLMVSARFAPRFHKRTMLKGLIERSIKRETTEWFRLYFDMVRTALEKRPNTSMGKLTDHDQNETKDNRQDTLLATLAAVERMYTIILVALVLLLAIFVVETFQAAQTFTLIRNIKAQMTTVGNEGSCPSDVEQ